MRTPGTDVIVKALRKRGVVTALLKPGVYRVQVGVLTVTAREDELEAPPPSKKKRRASAPLIDAGTGEGAADSSALAAIDLHGLAVDEARNRVAGHISRAILAGLDRVEVIHGIGTGRLKAAITKDLRAIAAVRAVKPHPTNPGVTVVYL
jgi:DNA mismatch repair protein MutS2